ncbi:MAG: type II toxin-antitoxin system death-on-curing family toxin [Candidatus Wallbacteria bacterium]|nr:type II toxin-antitoxin system death-on-curing family toxin [Candidatus Wallbacteria bacterium]
MITPDTSAVLDIHVRVIGTIQPFDMNLLDSAVHRPFQTFSGHEFYPDFLEKAAAILHGIICNHAFLDGNKRTAYAVASEMIEQHGYGLDTTDVERVVGFLVEVAESLHPVEEVRIFLKEILILHEGNEL